jgi:hypothetical protein
MPRVAPSTQPMPRVAPMLQTALCAAPTSPSVPRTTSVSPFACLSMPHAVLASRFAQPPGVPARTSSPHAKSSFYHPIFMARDPCSTHSMFTRHAADVMKPVDRLQLSSAATPLTLSPVPTSIYSVLTNPHRCCAMEEEYEALLLTARETWFLGLLGPMSSQTSGSSSTSSRRMILLTRTRLVGSFEVHSAARGGLQRDLQSCHQAYHRPDYADSGCLQRLPVHQVDVKNTFHHDTLSEMVYFS